MANWILTLLALLSVSLCQGSQVRLIDATIEKIPCPVPVMPTHLNFQLFEDTIAKQLRVAYWCKPRTFTLIGGNIATCQGQQWSDARPMCAATGCLAPNIPHGEVWDSEFDGAVIRIRCHLGYTTEGHWTKTLGCDGQNWNDTFPVCTEIGTRAQKQVQNQKDLADDSCWHRYDMYPFIRPPTVDQGTYVILSEFIIQRLAFIRYAQYRCMHEDSYAGSWKMYCYQGRWIGPSHSCKPGSVSRR